MPTLEQLLDIIDHQRIGAEYQPIKHTNTLHTAGHEALARFYTKENEALPPQLVFDTLHHSPITLVQVELISKRWQIEQAPGEGLLFLNVDPHAVTCPDSPDQTHPLLSLLKQPERTVIEIIENTNTQEADISMRLARELARKGFRSALDDIGAEATMLSIPILCEVDIFKFDRQWLRRRKQARQMHLLKVLLEFARTEGKMTIMEGIETHDDLMLARELGVDLVQGYLFRAEFISHRAG